MKRAFTTVLVVLSMGMVTSTWAQGQGPANRPSPRPLVSETIPLVGDLTKTVHFYHDLLGLQCRSGDPRVRLEWYDTRPFLEDMYGAVGGKLRSITFLTTGIANNGAPGDEMQIEAIEWQNAKGKPLNPRPQDVGATRMIFHVTDIDKLVGYLKRGGARIVTPGGTPIRVTGPDGAARAITFDDGNGFFVELVQPDMLPAQLLGSASDAPRSFIYATDTTVTVADIDKSAQFFRDVLGLNVAVDPTFRADPKRLQVIGLKGGEYREARVMWPDGTPQLNLVEFRGIQQKTLTPLAADPNATLMRIFVRDMSPVWAKVKTFPDAKIMDVSGAPTTPVQRPNAAQWLVIRLPGSTTYLQIIGLPNGRVG